MKNKIIVGFVCMLMMGSTLSLLFSASETKVSVLAGERTAVKECGCDQTTTSQRSTMSHILIDDSVPESPRPIIRSDLPPSFSWTDVNGTDWTTTAKDQGNCGSCWDFAAIGALESIIQIREGCPGLNLDLSEQYVLSCLSASGSCNGGWAYNGYKYMKSNSSAGNYCNGIIPEFCLPYEVNDDVPCSKVTENWQDFLMPLDSYGRWVPHGTEEDRLAMKTQIIESGPIVATMLFTIYSHGPDNIEEWGYTHTSPTDYYPYPGSKPGTNHQVVIVGWKDDATITNGGYWIVKNSLSEEWGYQGFFNLEYGSLNIDSSDINWVNYNASNFSNWVPVARIIGPTEGQANQELSFDGSSSFDHEGSLVSYEWAFGDETTGTGVQVSHTFTEPGIYLLTLIVTDNDGYTDTHTIWVSIETENHPPNTPWLIGRRNGENGKEYRYTFWSTDPDGDDVQYYLNWGDDYWFGGAAGWLGPYLPGERIVLKKNWTEKGNYTIRVKAMDQYGAKSDWKTLSVSMPISYNTPSQGFWEMLFERFPNAFPIARYLMGY